MVEIDGAAVGSSSCDHVVDRSVIAPSRRERGGILVVVVHAEGRASGGLVVTVELPGDQVGGMTAFDYADWATITTTRVDARGRVDYPKLAADRTTMSGHLAL